MKKRIIISAILALALILFGAYQKYAPRLGAHANPQEAPNASVGTSSVPTEQSTPEDSANRVVEKNEPSEPPSAPEEELPLNDLETAFNQAMMFAWNWFWDTKEIDRNDSIVEEYDGYDTNFYAVSADGITKKEDLRRLACQYFTESVVDDLMEQKGWIEKDGKLYVSESLGLGGSVPDRLYVSIEKEKTDCYAISLYEKMPNNGGVFTKELRYLLEDGNWVFDRAWANMGNARALLSFDYLTQPPVTNIGKHSYTTKNPYALPTDTGEVSRIEYTYYIPTITLEGECFDKINQNIRDTLQPIIDHSTDAIKAENYSVMESGGLSYRWFVNGDILTILIANEAKPYQSGGTEYILYHVSMSTGTELTDSDILEIAGYTREDFWQKVKEAAGTRFWNGLTPSSDAFNDPGFTEYFNSQLKKTLADTNVVQARPYFSEAGNLHVIVPVYSLAGADYYWQDLDLDNYQLVPYYAEFITRHETASGITEEEAYELAYQYWGDAASQLTQTTGFETTVVFDGVIEEKGAPYYAFRLRWWVSDGHGGGHSSTIDTLYVSTKDGAFRKPMGPS